MHDCSFERKWYSNCLRLIYRISYNFRDNTWKYNNGEEAGQVLFTELASLKILTGTFQIRPKWWGQVILTSSEMEKKNLKRQNDSLFIKFEGNLFFLLNIIFFQSFF